MELNKYIVIVAGGRGERMGGEIPKQLLEIAGKPILRHTMELFSELYNNLKIIVVMNADIVEIWKDYCRSSDFDCPHTLINGGITRFHSVQKGLSYVKEPSLVAIHDAVRPFLPRERIVEMFEKAESCKALIPILPIPDSMRQKTKNNLSPVKREDYFIVQTPQIFHSDILKAAYKQPYLTSFTDDASVVESYGVELTYCDGYRYNIKITTQDDLSFARFIAL